MSADRKLVYLIGAGPGDPSLITVKGSECLKKADVIIYDNYFSRSDSISRIGKYRITAFLIH
jgi:siroheme synthase